MEGLVSSSCDMLAKEIWTYCSERNTWLSAIYIPGKENNEADYMSRLLNENTEWKLDPHIFQKILKLFSVQPETDIFASHLNYQVPTYVSWNPDKNAYAIDAFSISWANIKFYAFPPFSLIGTSIPKIRRGMAAGIMVIAIKDFFSKCDQIRRKLRIWSHLLKKFLMENFIFCAVMGDTVLVSDYGASSPRFPNSTSSKCFVTTFQQGITTSLLTKNEIAGSSFIEEAFRYTEVPSEVTKVI